MRATKRLNNEMRKVTLEVNACKYGEGSCMACFGDTKVMCVASLEDKLPMWLKGAKQGWISAEYGMLPRSTEERMEREAARGFQTGRTQEIQRLIGRCLRACVDLKKIPDIAIKVDCDVIQADGGTRTAAITGGFCALYLALARMERAGILKKIPIISTISAVSAGFYEGRPILDLDYMEDSNAETDANFCITGDGRIVEIQGTAEKMPFTREELDRLLDLAFKGTEELARIQRRVLKINRKEREDEREAEAAAQRAAERAAEREAKAAGMLTPATAFDTTEDEDADDILEVEEFTEEEVILDDGDSDENEDKPSRTLTLKRT
jgi:ribonuclease PH